MTLYLGLHFFRASSYYDFESAQLLSNLVSGVVSLTCEQYLAAGPTALFPRLDIASQAPKRT